MKQCPDCKTFKKADNCIECAVAAKNKLTELKLCLREILATSSMFALGERLEKLLQKESDS